MQPNRPQDLVRTTLQLIALGALMLSSFWIVRPFLVALTWAVMIAVSTWPLLLHAQAWLGGRRSLAVAVMTIALLLVLLVPFYFGLTAIVENARQIADWSKSLGTVVLPQPPAWLAGVPEPLAREAGEEIRAREQLVELIEQGRHFDQGGPRVLQVDRKRCPLASRPSPAGSYSGSSVRWAVSACCSSSSCSP